MPVGFCIVSFTFVFIWQQLFVRVVDFLPPVPMLRVFNNTARYVDQGGNKRPGAFAVYLEPWHPDVLQFVDLRKNTGAEEIRARDLFLALWIPDLFMRRVEQNADWTFMDPHECPGLEDCWGEEFEALYTKYEREGRGRRTARAQEVWYVKLFICSNHNS